MLISVNNVLVNLAGTIVSIALFNVEYLFATFFLLISPILSLASTCSVCADYECSRKHNEMQAFL
jgi:hypothetical protein